MNDRRYSHAPLNWTDVIFHMLVNFFALLPQYSELKIVFEFEIVFILMETMKGQNIFWNRILFLTCYWILSDLMHILEQ